jgi:hypothetical protein
VGPLLLPSHMSDILLDGCCQFITSDLPQWRWSQMRHNVFAYS